MSGASTRPTASEGEGPGPSGAAGGVTPLLELRGITKRFGGLPAVNDLSCSVARGEVLGIIGPNGAGKSTLIGLIGGAIAPTAGTVIYDGRDISHLPPHKRTHLGIGRTFQITQPFAGLDVRENVLVGALFGRGGGLSRSAGLRIADEVLERVGLADKATAKGDQLTVADRKRLEMARALATNPRLLLLDEVMAGLTPSEVSQAVALIRDINASGVTVLVVEHIVRAIRDVSDRVLVLHHGRKIAEDVPDEVLADPRVIEAYLGERYTRSKQGKGATESGMEAGDEWKGGLA